VRARPCPRAPAGVCVCVAAGVVVL
jgi:hypothetical protein